MQLPLQITFRNMERSDFVENNIREHAEQLDQFVENIMSCRVVIEAPHRHQNQGNLFHVSINITLPGHEINVSKGRDKHQAHEDAYVAIHDAFDAARRQLQELQRKRRGNVKQHEQPPHGRISQIFPMEDYGVIQSSDGRDIYFHRNSVLDLEFDKLEIGYEVRFHEESGEQGPQASSVNVIGKHHIVG